MARRIDQIDAKRLACVLAICGTKGDCAIFREDRDSALALQGVRIEHAISRFLSSIKGAAARKQRVHEGGLAMIDVGNDGHVPQVWVGWVEHEAKIIAPNTDNAIDRMQLRLVLVPSDGIS